MVNLNAPLSLIKRPVDTNYELVKKHKSALVGCALLLMVDFFLASAYHLAYMLVTVSFANPFLSNSLKIMYL